MREGECPVILPVCIGFGARKSPGKTAFPGAQTIDKPIDMNIQHCGTATMGFGAAAPIS